VVLNPLTYVRESYLELKKVIWPSRAESFRLTVVVIVVSIFVGAYIAGLDFVFAKAVALIINK